MDLFGKILWLGSKFLEMTWIVEIDLGSDFGNLVEFDQGWTTN